MGNTKGGSEVRHLTGERPLLDKLGKPKNINRRLKNSLVEGELF